MPGIDIVIRSKQAELPAPVVAQLRRLIFKFVPEDEGGIHASIARQRTFPVLFEREDSISRGFSEWRAEKEPRGFDAELPRLSFGIPRQPAPNRFIHIIVHTVRVGKEAAGIGAEIVLQELEKSRTRVRRLAAQRERKSRVPPGRLVLAANRVRDIRVIAQA